MVESCNLCLMEGKFRDTLKVSRVVPVYKNGDRSMVSIYHPMP